VSPRSKGASVPGGKSDTALLAELVAVIRGPKSAAQVVRVREILRALGPMRQQLQQVLDLCSEAELMIDAATSPLTGGNDA
jgi:hypothetical protein